MRLEAPTCPGPGGQKQLKELKERKECFNIVTFESSKWYILKNGPDSGRHSKIVILGFRTGRKC